MRQARKKNTIKSNNVNSAWNKKLIQKNKEEARKRQGYTANIRQESYRQLQASQANSGQETQATQVNGNFQANNENPSKSTHMSTGNSSADQVTTPPYTPGATANQEKMNQVIAGFEESLKDMSAEERSHLAFPRSRARGEASPTFGRL